MRQEHFTLRFRADVEPSKGRHFEKNKAARRRRWSAQDMRGRDGSAPAPTPRGGLGERETQGGRRVIPFAATCVAVASLLVAGTAHADGWMPKPPGALTTVGANVTSVFRATKNMLENRSSMSTRW